MSHLKQRLIFGVLVLLFVFTAGMLVVRELRIPKPSVVPSAPEQGVYIGPEGPGHPQPNGVTREVTPITPAEPSSLASTRFAAQVEFLPDWLGSVVGGESSFELEGQDGTVAAKRFAGANWNGTLADGEYEIRSVRVLGRRYRFESVPPISSRKPKAEVRLLSQMDFQLIAVDAQTGSEVKAVKVMALSGPDLSRRTVLEQLRPAGEAAVGVSVLLPDRGDVPTVFAVEAEGYSLATFERLPFTPSVRMPLDPSAALTLRVTASADVAQAIHRVSFSIHRQGSNTIPGARVEELVAPLNEDVLLPHLVTGVYEICVRSHSAEGGGPVLAVSTVDVLFGQTNTAKIDLPEQLPRPSGCRVILGGDGLGAGTLAQLRIDVYTEDSSPSRRRVRSYPSIEWISPVDGAARYFDIADLSEGSYRIILRPLGLEEAVDLVAGEVDQVLFEISDLCAVTVSTDPSITQNQTLVLRWGYAELGLSPADQKSMLPARPMAFNCSSRPIWVQAIGDMYSSDRISIHPLPYQDNHVQLTWRPTDAPTLLLTVNPPDMAVDDDYWPSVKIDGVSAGGQLLSIRLADRDGRANFQGQAHSTAAFLLSEAGSYNLTFSDMHGNVRHDVLTVTRGKNQHVLRLE